MLLTICVFYFRFINADDIMYRFVGNGPTPDLRAINVNILMAMIIKSSSMTICIWVQYGTFLNFVRDRSGKPRIMRRAS